MSLGLQKTRWPRDETTWRSEETRDRPRLQTKYPKKILDECLSIKNKQHNSKSEDEEITKKNE